MTNVVGLDLSLTATGYACHHAAIVLWPPDDRPTVKGRKPKRTLNDDLARLDWLESAVREELRADDPVDLAVIEGYSRGSLARREEAGELGGLVRLRCWRMGVPIALVSPKSLKAFAVNDGGADKTKMALAAAKLGWEGDSHDACDAWWLRQMGLYACTWLTEGQCVVPCAAYRDDAVGKIAWPAHDPAPVTYPFVDVVAGDTVALSLQPLGVTHTGCDALANVTVELDAFYCPACGRNGRVSGAWVVDMLAKLAPVEATA